MAFSKEDGFLAKLLVITGKVERMRDDIEKLAKEMESLRSRIAQLEDPKSDEEGSAKIARLRPATATKKKLQSDAKRLQKNVSDLSHRLSAAEGWIEPNSRRRVAGKGDSRD